MNRNRPPTAKLQKRVFRASLFPSSVLVIYGILFAVMPEKAAMAFKSSSIIFLNIIFPLCLVFILMLVLNLVMKPAHIVKFLGKGTAIRGIILTMIAGIISMGPIYTWYTLLKELREKGVENSLIAIFLGTRAIKPFLLPVMISYFGWIYTIILTVATILGALAVGYSVSVMVKEESS